MGANQQTDVILFARQPLFESSGRVHGYELLFRRPDGSGWPIGDESQATAHVVVSAFADKGLPEVTSGLKAWINVPKQFMLDAELDVLPKQHVVIELLERDEVDDAMVAKTQQLAREGYEIALDDFEWRDELEPLVRCATYVKLDMRALGIAGMARESRKLGEYDVRIVAEKVETDEEREACTRLGIGLFQGYYFERPRLVRGRPAPRQDIGRLQQATRLGARATFEDIEAVLRMDPGMSFRLLRYVNSAAVGLRHQVTSLRQTLMLVGSNTVRQWLLLVLMSDMGAGSPELLRSGLVRARICELLAIQNRVKPETAFVAGLLSVCDALFDRTMEEVVIDLPLSDELRDALVDGTGKLGILLKVAVAAQHGEGEVPPTAAQAAAEAIRWADAQLSTLVSPQQAAA